MKSTFYGVVAIIIFFSSCTSERETETIKNTTVQASIDFAKLSESGPSQIKYNSKTKENVIISTDWYLADLRLSGLGSVSREDEPGTAAGEAGATPAAGQATDAISVRYGLEYIGKGAKFPGAGSNTAINLNYLEVPIDAVYHLPAGPGRIEAGLGPYFAYGIGGSSNGVSSFGQNNGGFKRFDAGLNLQAGYQFDNGLSLRLGYDLGLANVEYADQDVKGHTRTLSINLGYQIGRLFGKK